MECTSEGRNGCFGKMKKEGWLWREGRVATSEQKCEWDDSRCLRVFKSGKLDLKITWTLPQVPSVSRCVTLPGCDMMKWYQDRYNWCSDRYNYTTDSHDCIRRNREKEMRYGAWPRKHDMRTDTSRCIVVSPGQGGLLWSLTQHLGLFISENLKRYSDKRQPRCPGVDV